jgi:hypothetical protein
MDIPFSSLSSLSSLASLAYPLADRAACGRPPPPPPLWRSVTNGSARPESGALVSETEAEEEEVAEAS